MSVESILNDFGVSLVKDLQDSLAKKQKAKASKYGSAYNPNSDLANSIKFTISNKEGGVYFSLTMNDYWRFVDLGRRAGNVSKEGQSKISYWIKKKDVDPVSIIMKMRMQAREKKGIQSVYKPRVKLTFAKATKAFTFLTARKLKKKGYDGNSFFTEVINDGRVEVLKELIQKELNREIEIIINGNHSN
jgi:hypothetical protein